MRAMNTVVLAVAAVCLGACDERSDRIVGVPGGTAGREAASIPAEHAAQQVARGIALTLANPEMRTLVRDAMRASPYQEHKLVLQSFLDTDAGKPLLAGLAAAMGIPQVAVRQRLQALPALDFYLPVRAHRFTWRATDDVLVGAAFFHTGETSVELVGVDGRAVEWPRDGSGPQSPVIILHPAERKSLRAASAGPPARKAAADLAVDGCDPSVIECDTAPPPTTYAITHGVYINHFNPQDDDGWFGGDDELEFTITFPHIFPDIGQTVVIRRNQPPFVGSDELIFVSSHACDPMAPPPFSLSIKEQDGFSDDDDWGTYQFPPHNYGVMEELWKDGDRKMWIRFICR